MDKMSQLITSISERVFGPFIHKLYKKPVCFQVFRGIQFLKYFKNDELTCL